MQSAIYGVEGLELSDSERDFFRDADPAGYIIFRRNCSDRDQLLRLTDSLREISGRPDLPILIDQEGGRVARMQPPERSRPISAAVSREERKPARTPSRTIGTLWPSTPSSSQR